MQRQQGGLVPIGEALADLPGPVQALRETPPPARRGFTLADQVNRLVTARESDPDLGFQARMMALCSLPRTNPGNRLQYKRTNGPYTLGMECRNRQQTSLRQLGPLADGVDFDRGGQEFMNKLDINSESAGRSGERTRLRNQMDRLFNSTVQFIYEPKAPDGASLGVKDTFGSTVARKMHLVWNPSTAPPSL